MSSWLEQKLVCHLFLPEGWRNFQNTNEKLRTSSNGHLFYVQPKRDGNWTPDSSP